MPGPEILNVRPEEAIRHFRAKGYHTAFSWLDTDAAAHLRSFTVAKAMPQDILTDIRQAVDAAIAAGESFSKFRHRLQETLVKKGWWGQQILRDPLTGKDRLVQLGSVRRLRTIFETNLRTAYARGRWERIERLQDRMPYLRYVAVQDARTRPEHAAWHGVVLPVDDPWWSTHYPPNGWGCRCTVMQLDDDDLQRYGYRLTDGTPPFSTRADLRPWRNKRTGQVHQIPRGIDPGWAHNVGQTGVAQGIINDIPGAAAMAAAPGDADGFILAGRLVREDLVQQAGGAAAFSPVRFRGLLRDRLARERGAGEVIANITGGGLAQDVKQDIAGLFPRSWIEQANKIPALAVVAQDRGKYSPARGAGQAAELHVRGDRGGRWAGYWQGGRIHEYVHHLQVSMPGLDKLFSDLHRRRTRGEPLVEVTRGYPDELGRKDRYLLEYQGREYSARVRSGSADSGNPLEVITMAYQYIWQTHLRTPGDRGFWGGNYNLLEKDPEMLDLALGALFKYDP